MAIRSKADTVPVDFLPDGYAVASINYRLVPRHIFPSQILTASRRAVPARPCREVQPRPAALLRVGLLRRRAARDAAGDLRQCPESRREGRNARTSSTVQLVVDFSGPSDFLTMQSQSPPGDMLDHNAASSVESMYMARLCNSTPP